MQSKVLFNFDGYSVEVFFGYSFLSQTMLKASLIHFLKSFYLVQSDPFLVMIYRVDNVLVTLPFDMSSIGYSFFEPPARVFFNIILINSSNNINCSEIIIIFLSTIAGTSIFNSWLIDLVRALCIIRWSQC
jgi:hypothetical protein